MSSQSSVESSVWLPRFRYRNGSSFGEDVLSAFRLIDALALRVDVNPTSRKLELFKKLAKEKLSVPQKRALAIVGLKLADDALELEEYGNPAGLTSVRHVTLQCTNDNPRYDDLGALYVGMGSQRSC